MVNRIQVRRDTLANFVAFGVVPANGEPIAVVDAAAGRATSYVIGDGVSTVDQLPALSKGDTGDPAPIDGVPQFHGVQQTSYGHSFGQVQSPPNVWPLSVYPTRLRDALQTDPSLYQNRTVSGSNMTQIAAKAASTWSDGTGGIVTLMGNQNSVGQGQSESSFKDALRSFISTIRGSTGTPPLLLIIKDTTCTQTGYKRYSPAPTDNDVARFNRYVDDVVAESAYDWVVVADPQDAGWDPTIMTCPDGQHPNDLGMAHIAATALNVLRHVPWRPGLNIGVSSVVGTAPSAISIAATPGNGTATITRSGGLGAGVTYALYRGSTPTGTPVATNFPFTDTGLSNGTPVSYVATAKNAYGAVTSSVVTVSPAVPTLHIVDSFDRADSSNLGSADSGQPWITGGTDGFGVLANAAARGATTVAGTTADSLAVIATDAADIDLSIVVAALSTTGGLGPIWRFSDASNYWLIDALPNATAKLYKKVAGTFSSVADLGVTLVAGDTLRVVTAGPTHTVYVNATQRAAASDGFNGTATSHGMRIANNVVGSPVSDRKLDSFTIQ
jgi:hypothetical protein